MDAFETNIQQMSMKGHQRPVGSISHKFSKQFLFLFVCHFPQLCLCPISHNPLKLVYQFCFFSKTRPVSLKNIKDPPLISGMFL